MPNKEYRFPHSASAQKVADRLYVELQKQAVEQGMTLTRVSNLEFKATRTGAKLTFTVGPHDLVVVADLSFFAEPFRGKLEAGLNQGMPTMLRECELA